MPLPVSLQAVVDRLGRQSDESTTYLHKPIGDLIQLDPTLLSWVEGGHRELGDESGRRSASPPNR